MLKKKIHINKNINIEKKEKFYLITDKEDKLMLAINDFGKYILDFEGKRVKDIIEILIIENNMIKSSKIEKDVIEFIEDCIDREVIHLD